MDQRVKVPAAKPDSVVSIPKAVQKCWPASGFFCVSLSPSAVHLRILQRLVPSCLVAHREEDSPSAGL